MNTEGPLIGSQQPDTCPYFVQKNPVHAIPTALTSI